MGLESTLPQLAVALLVLVGLLILLGLGAKRWPLRRNPDSRLQVVSSISIGSREKLVVISFEDQRLLLGVTSQSINALCASGRPSKPETFSLPRLVRSAEDAK